MGLVRPRAIPDTRDNLVPEHRNGSGSKRRSAGKLPLEVAIGTGEEPESDRCDRIERHRKPTQLRDGVFQPFTGSNTGVDRVEDRPVQARKGSCVGRRVARKIAWPTLPSRGLRGRGLLWGSSQTWRRTGQLTGQLLGLRRGMHGGGEAPVHAVSSRHVAPRGLSRLLCKPEITGSIPVRSIALRSRFSSVEDGRRRATRHVLVAFEPQAQSGFLV